jgi:hypothetical protein
MKISEHLDQLNGALKKVSQQEIEKPFHVEQQTRGSLNYWTKQIFLVSFRLNQRFT